MELKAENIFFRYDTCGPWILENINFNVQSGERVGMFAPSGYGKSTFAKILSGYCAPDRGRIELDGDMLPRKGVCPVQLIYQHPEKAINPRWRLQKVLEESGRIQPEILEAFGIQLQWLKRFPYELSGGELQRFCVARALTCGAKFLICDEISTMLDVITQAQIWRVILKIASEKNMGLVVITHNLELAKRVCTKVYDLTKQIYIPI